MPSDQEVLSQLAKLINQSQGGSFLKQPTTERMGSRPGKSPESRDEAARAKDAAKIMSNEISSTMKKSLKELPKELQKALNKSGDKLVKDIAGTTKNLEDVLRADDQIAAMKQITARLNEIRDTKFESEEELQEHLDAMGKLAEDAGMSLNQFGIKAEAVGDDLEDLSYRVADADEVVEKLTESTETYTDVMEEAREATEELSKMTARTSKALDVFWSILKNSAKLGEQEARFAMQRATADQGLIKGVTELQISQIEYAKILADTRQEQFAMQSAGVDFNKVLREGTKELQGFTSSNEEAAQVAAMVVKNVSRMGVSQDQLAGEVKNQIAAYKEQARAYGISALEMAKLTENLMEDDDYRMQIIRFRGKERAEFVRGIAQRQAEYKQMGYTTERAKEVEKSFAALTAMSPKERMKQAAKQRAMLGALGMGAEGAELQQLQTKIKYAKTPEERARMQKRLTEIQSQASNKFLERTGAGASVGSAMAFEQMAEKTGFSTMVKTFETTSGKGLEHQASTAAATKEINATLKSGIFAKDTYNALEKSALPSIATGILTAVIGGFASMAALYVSGKMAKGLLKTTKMFKGGPTAKITAEAGVDTAKNAAKGAAKSVGKVGGKAALKSAAKKIPVIGALMGIGFGIGRLMDGDVLGAGMEVASGVMGAFPGFGTVGSIAMDTALAGRDLKTPSEDELASAIETPEEQKAVTTTETKKTTRISTNEQLLKTLQELQVYLKVVNEQNMEQAKAVTKTGEANEKAIRFNSMNDRRPDF